MRGKSYLNHQRKLLFSCFILIFLFSNESYGDIRDSNPMMVCRSQSGAAALDACNRVILELPADSPPDMVAEVHAAKGVVLGELGRTDEASLRIEICRKAFSPKSKISIQYGRGVGRKGEGLVGSRSL